MSAPLNLFLWLIYFYQNIYYVVVVSALFYLLVTSRKYIDFCRSHRDITSMDIEEEDIEIATKV